MTTGRKFSGIKVMATMGLLLYVHCLSAFTGDQGNVQQTNPFSGNWALVLPDGAAAWLSFHLKDSQLAGEIWTVGAPNKITDLMQTRDTLFFKRKCAIGDPDYPGGAPTGNRILVQHRAYVRGDLMQLVMERPMDDGSIQELSFSGKRLPPMPQRPDLSKVVYGEPKPLFNGKDLTGWHLTNPQQINGWKVEDGILVNETPKLSFDPFSQYGNLRTEAEFEDFNLKLEFNVPPGGNSGVYLKGRYEAQVVDRDSRMQGIQGVGAIFGRITPRENAGRAGGEWQSYDITLVDRHITVILNGIKVIDNQPIIGATKGALCADDTRPVRFIYRVIIRL